MSWTSPRTFVTGEVVTAAHLNVHLRDNLVDLDRRTSPVVSGNFSVQGCASAVYGDITTVGPAVTATIGATNKALLSMMCRQYNDLAGESTLMGVAFSGASTIPAGDSLSLSFTSPTVLGEVRHGTTIPLTTLTAGVTTATLKYRRTGVGTGYFGDRFIIFQPLGA